MKKLFKILFYLAGLLSLIVLLTNVWIIGNTKDQIFHSVADLPNNAVGLVLGTSHRLQNGDSNMFFTQRIDQATLLYKTGKIRHIIVSGDNSTPYYNEPVTMRRALISHGVPDSVIHMDFAGFRTLDSVVRSKLVFGQTSITVITQDFHSPRALFIAQQHGIKAVASVGEKLPWKVSVKIEMREVLARTLALWDLFVLDTSPKFLGKKEVIPV